MQQMSGISGTIQGADGDGIQLAIESKLHDFYSKHVIPFASFPDSDRPQDFYLLIGTQCGHRTTLWATDTTTVRYCMPYGAVGAGGMYAKMLLNRLWSRMDVDLAQIVAAYVVYCVKETIEGCGKSTHVVRLKDGHAQYMQTTDVQRLEELFKHWEGIETRALHHVLGYQYTDPAADFADVSSWLESLRRDFAVFHGNPTISPNDQT
jgi:hypothetical protein